MQIIIVENHSHAPAGLVNDCILARGWDVRTVSPNDENAEPLSSQFADLTDVDAVVSLGGKQDAWDDSANPGLMDQVHFLKRCDDTGIPVLGLCLGGQLLARAFGAEVHRMDNGPERGLVSLFPAKDSAAARVLFPDVSVAYTLMSWHQDMFELPEQAELILSSSVCAHQGFFVGNCSYGLQCHIEATPEIVKTWVSKSPEWQKRMSIEFQERFDQVMATGRTIINAWLDYVENQRD